MPIPFSLAAPFQHSLGVGLETPARAAAPRRVGRRMAPENWVAFFALADALSIALSCGLAGGLAQDFTAPLDRGAALVYLLLHGLFGRSFGAFDPGRIFAPGHAVAAAIKSFGAASVALLMVMTALNAQNGPSGPWLYGACGLATAMAALLRVAALTALRARLGQGDFVQRAVSAALNCEPLSDSEIGKAGGSGVSAVRTLRLGALDELPALIDQLVQDHIDVVYLRAPWAETPRTLERLASLRHYAIRIFVIPDEDRVSAHQLGVARLGGRLAIAGVDRPLDDWGLWLKRAQDVALSALLLLALAPVMALVALAIRLDSPGPALFRQPRAGLNGRLFDVWKFRSMACDQADYAAAVQTRRNDPRVTRVGRFIRRTSLDELPQFFNVLQGTMSLVGPRPHAVDTRAEGRALEETVTRYAARHRVKPGLTGLAQISGCRGPLDSVDKLRRRVALDLDYIENWSTGLDLRIILRTAWLVLHDPAAF